MVNKEFLNICYKFFNRFISLTKLIELLGDMDKTAYDKEEINKVINDLKSIDKEVPNSVDEYVTKAKENLQRMIDRLEEIPLKEDNKDFINKRLVELRNEQKREIDSHERWLKALDYINKNKYFNELFESLTDYELLEFIAQNISAPFPPQFSQEEFDRLVKVGIEHDKREWLWRLAFNYEFSKMNFDKIVDYYIEKKDAYYLSELISAVGECLNIDDIINKLNDIDIIKYLVNNYPVIKDHVNSEKLNELIKKLLYLNIDKIHTTKLGIDRIKKNLHLDKVDVVDYIKNKILDKKCEVYKEGKNYYCIIDNIKITINSYNFSIITAHVKEGK